MLKITIRESAERKLEEQVRPLLNEEAGRLRLERRFKTNKDDERWLYQITPNFENISTSYFIGMDWLIPEKLALHVHSKLDDTAQSQEIDCLAMLTEALEETENLRHLDGLCDIDFNAPLIDLEGQPDLLTPFLLIEYLSVLKLIAKKGLLKSYSLVDENLNSKIKGKILISKSIKFNLSRSRKDRNFCRYQVYTADIPQNRLLKKALGIAAQKLKSLQTLIKPEILGQALRFLNSAFAEVSEEASLEESKYLKADAMHREYGMALKLARMILRKESLHTAASEQREQTPPYWIDMSRLFELYVYKKLRAHFSLDRLKYHPKVRFQEPDFLLFPQDDEEGMIIDAKYKPYYKEGGISLDDARQVAGYARLEKIYNDFRLSDRRRNIRCLIVYAHQSCPENLPKISAQYLENPKNKVKFDGYVDLYKLGIRLPTVIRQD